MKKIILIIILFLIGCIEPKYKQFETIETLPQNALSNVSIIDQFLLTQFRDKYVEEFIVIYFENDKYLSWEVIATGGATHVEVNGLKIVINSTIRKANKIIIAHNHVGQYYATPSYQDYDAALKLKDMLKQGNIELISSIVASINDTYWIE